MVNKNKIKIQKINDFAKAGNLKIVKKVLEPEAEKEKTKIEKARIEKIKTQNFKNNFKNKDEPIKDLKPEAWRYVILFSFIILAFLYLFWTLFKVQILENKKYADLREKQYKLLTQNTENRGTIYGKDKNGEIIPLAINKKEYKLVLSPKDLDQNYLTIIYNLVNKITPIDNADFLKSATKKNDAYEEIKDLTNDEAEKIKNLKVNGVSVAEKEERFYPLKNVASQVVGFIGDGEGGIKGRYGLEKYYNDILQKNQINKNSFFAALFKDLNDGNFNNKNEEIGKSLNIVTTLEPNVMNYLNAELQNIYTQWSPDMAAGIIMDTKTGGDFSDGLDSVL
jgi:stage V sporulation protein D (sporulation-specific penicillin-binding protein)